MDYLWTPWRYQYISNVDNTDRCPFCLEASTEDDDRRLVVHRAEHNFVILNMFPYTSGHLLICTYRHLGNFSEASPAQIAEMMLLAQQCKEVLEKCYHPAGFNIGMNLGRCAGAGVDQHIHMHVVPRWAGDANCMTVVSETRVLPESLETTHRKLKQGFRQL